MIILVVAITLWAQDVLWTFDGHLFFTFRRPRDDLQMSVRREFTHYAQVF